MTPGQRDVWVAVFAAKMAAVVGDGQASADGLTYRFGGPSAEDAVEAASAATFAVSLLGEAREVVARYVAAEADARDESVEWAARVLAAVDEVVGHNREEEVDDGG